MSYRLSKPETDLIVPDRRTFLQRAGTATLSASAVALIVGCESMAKSEKGGAQMASADHMKADVDILNTAVAAEYEAIAAYQVGAESGLLQKPVLDLAVQFQGQHKEHAQVLSGAVTKLGGTPALPKASYEFPVDQLKSQSDVLQFAAGLEQGAASAYLGAVPLFHDRDLAKAAASILGDEAMHWAILRQALGEDPVPAAFIS